MEADVDRMCTERRWTVEDVVVVFATRTRFRADSERGDARVAKAGVEAAVVGTSDGRWTGRVG